MTATKTRLLILSWRDIKSRKRGGAEVYTHELFKRLPQDRYQVTHFSPLEPGLPAHETIDGIVYLRAGNVLTVIPQAYAYYRRHRQQFDLIIDQCNTHRFFTPFWVPRDRRALLIHQFTREIWFANAPFPFNHVGYRLETPLIRLYRKDFTITVSESTRQDLLDTGFAPERIAIVYNGLDFEAWKPEQFKPKDGSVFLYLGRMSRYKGIDHAIEAFARIKSRYPQTRLWLVGADSDGILDGLIKPLIAQHHLKVGNDEERDDVVIWGFVDEEKKRELMSRAQALLFPAVREGWGRTITEAAAVGTPSIVYPAPGVIDAVKSGECGFLTEARTVPALVQKMAVVLEDEREYACIRTAAHVFAKTLTWERSAHALDAVLQQKIVH